MKKENSRGRAALHWGHKSGWQPGVEQESALLAQSLEAQLLRRWRGWRRQKRAHDWCPLRPAVKRGDGDCETQINDSMVLCITA